MLKIVLLGSVLCVCGSYIDVVQGASSFTADTNIDREPPLFTLDSNGELHSDGRSRQHITRESEIGKLRKSRRKKPIDEILAQSHSRQIGVRSDIFGGEVISLQGDTAGPGVEGIPEILSLLNRHKRRAYNTRQYHVIELLLVFDHEIYKFWLGRNQGDAYLAKDEMIDFYANIINAVNTRYASLRTRTFSIFVKVVGIIIGDAPGTTPWTERLAVNGTVESIPALDAFTFYINTNRSRLPQHDHAITITGFNLARDGRTGLVGLANQNRTCTPQSTSIVEALKSQETATLIAHEIAHSVGANHDADRNNCDNDAKFVMSTKISVPGRANASNPWTFSTCSAESIMDYVARTANQCTLRKSSTPVNLHRYLKDEFGQKYPHDVQCELFRGVGSTFCRTVYFTGNRTFDDICHSLFCLDPDDGLCYPTLAHDGTTCGNKKWCRSGVCTASRSAPTTPENCPAGDDPDVDCKVSRCTDQSIRDEFCCGTCKRNPPPREPPIIHPFPPSGHFPSQNAFPFDSGFFEPFKQDPFPPTNFFNPFATNKQPPSKPNKPRPSSNNGFLTNLHGVNQHFDSVFSDFNDIFSFAHFGKK